METEEERQARRRARIAEMKRAKRRRELLYKWGVPAMAAVAVMAGVGIGFRAAAFSVTAARPPYPPFTKRQTVKPSLSPSR